jgi:uncharacterized protein YbjT (DUF2867 family)
VIVIPGNEEHDVSDSYEVVGAGSTITRDEIASDELCTIGRPVGLPELTVGEEVERAIGDGEVVGPRAESAGLDIGDELGSEGRAI